MTTQNPGAGCGCGARPPETPAGPSRRAVLGAAGAVGAAGLLAACGGGGGTPLAEATGSPDEEVIVDLETLRSEGAVAFRTAVGDALAIDMGGEIVAYTRRCPHEGCAVSWDADRQVIACPCHGSRFDAADDGAVLAGPARSPLPAVDVIVDEDAGVLRRV